MKRPSTLVAWSVGACLVVGIVAYRLGRARADGVPAVNPLYYGGVLSDGGRPVEGARNVTVRLWDAATAGATVCSTTAAGAMFTGGRFRVALDAACVGAVRANPELWAEVQVEGTTFPRSKLGAVPYALEAGRAVTASGATGALAVRVAAVEAMAQRPQVEYSVGGSGISVGSGARITLAVTDSAITFTPRMTAIYSVFSSCSVSGRADLSIAFLSTPAPTDVRSGPASVNNVLARDPCLSPQYRITSSVLVQSVVTLQRGVPYTAQISANVENFSCGSGSSSFSTTDIQCGPLVVTQLN